jgi:hypothetical protein
MSDRSYTRLTRYAVITGASVPAVLIWLLSPIPSLGVALVYLIALPFWYLAIGPYQADIALNTDLDETGRRWWRIALFLVPGAMTLYWHRYVRR